MKRAAAALLASAGCNAWFGLDPTRELEPDAAPTFATAQVVAQVATTDTTGAPNPAGYAGIAGLAVSVGPPAGPLVAAAIDTDGNVAVPAELLAGPWRLVYQIGSGVPVEHQWQPTHPVICVPRFGHLERAPVAAADYVRMAPTNIGAYVAPRLLTSGVWTSTRLPNPPGDGQGHVTFPFANAQPLDGALGAPSGGAGDWEMVVDFHAVSGGTEAYGYAKAPAALVAAGDPAVAPGFEPTPAQPQPTAFTDKLQSLSVMQLFTAGLGALYTSPSTDASHAAVGLVPSGDVPALGLDGAFVVELGSYDGADFPSTYKPVNPVEVGVPRAVYLRRTTRRTVHGVVLESAIERLDLGTLADYPRSAAAAIAVGIASAVTLDGVDLATADGVALPASTAPRTLAFTVVMGAADDAVATVYRVDPTGLVALRRYVTTGTTVAIDPAVLAAGSTYAISIELRTGYPTASVGDYRAVAYPLAASRIVAATFTVQ